MIEVKNMRELIVTHVEITEKGITALKGTYNKKKEENQK